MTMADPRNIQEMNVHMDRALALARRAEGSTHPNPMVGAVLVKAGKMVGEGWHRHPGEDHAEVAAIGNAGGLAAGSTLYVNLEPCHHTGRTGPCTTAIIEAGITRVVVGCRDKNPKVDGRGIDALRKAGLEVTVGVREKKAMELNRAFLHFAQYDKPYVTLKLASTLDGRIATSSGESRWITGESSRRSVHRLRAAVDGILVGAGTALADDPVLNVRGVKAARQPVRLVLDSELRISPGSRLVTAENAGPLYLLAGSDASRKRESSLTDAGATVVRLPLDNGVFTWRDLAPELMKAGIYHLLVEGGGQTAAWFIGQQAVQRVEMFLAPAFIGAEGIPSLGDMGIASLDKAPALSIVHTRRLDNDLRITADVIRAGL
jgi:diaminohydroxyphosphoribosylaminopyrimidine deaminase/5-amino-6-(5-phosphoribosylamino)uracil reductase